MIDADEIKPLMPDYLARVHGITGVRRPFRCLNPSHDDTHPSMTLDVKTNRVKCWSCGWSGDVFDLAALDTGLGDSDSFADKTQAVLDALGKSSYEPVEVKQQIQNPISKPTLSILNRVQQAAFELLTRPEAKQAYCYLKARGFTDEGIAGNLFGWVSDPRELMRGGFDYLKARPGGYVVLPFIEGEARTRCCYAVVRPVIRREGEPKEYKPRGYRAPIWGAWRLNSGSSRVYVTEGIFDAVALNQLFSVASVAVMGSGINRLVNKCQACSGHGLAPLVLAFDNDAAGREKTRQAAEALRQAGVGFTVAPPYPEGCKDANEILIKEVKNEQNSRSVA